MRRSTRARAAGLLLAGWLTGSGSAAAQAQPATPAPELPDTRNVEIDPIRCWTRATPDAVRIGEVFTLTLTCAVLETDAVQVVPDESRLPQNVVQLAPFEVLDGRHPPDLRSGSRRFFQYDYRLRLIGPDVVGTDVPLPLIQINYRINSRVAANTAQQGRELVYVLPPTTIRVLSLVPADANDIRQSGDPSFLKIEAIAFRAGVLQIAAMTAAVLGALITLFAVIGLVRRTAKAKGPKDRLLGRPALMGLALRELSSAQRDGTGQGWTPTIISRAAAAFRLAAAGALDKPISQRIIDRDVDVDESQFVVRRYGLRRDATAQRITVSSAVTSGDASRAKARLGARATPAQQQLFDELESTLASLASAQFGRASDTTVARDNIDVTVTKALELARQFKSEHSWPRAWLRRLTRRPLQLQRQT